MGLSPVWDLIKYAILWIFHIWLFFKRVARVFWIPAIIVQYDMSKLSLAKKMISPFKEIIIPVISIFNAWERIAHFDHVVYTVPKGKVFGCYTIATSDNKILRDVTRWHQTDKWTNMYAYKFLPGKAKYIQGNVAVLTWNDTDKNYHHRITTALPKYYVLQKSGISIDTYITDTNYQFHKETLQALWIKDTQIIVPIKDSYYQCENLICTNSTTLYGFMQPWAVKFIKELFLGWWQNQKLTRKVYVKRITNRKIANEAEFDAYITSQGFEIHVMEWKTIKEQANLFNQASVIISPHGAGLTNIVFCQPWATVIELFHPETLFGHYYAMAASCDLQYVPVVWKIKKNPKRIAMDCDMIIDIEKLDSILKEKNQM